MRMTSSHPPSFAPAGYPLRLAEVRNAARQARAAAVEEPVSAAEIAEWTAHEYHGVAGEVDCQAKNALWSAAWAYLIDPETFEAGGEWIDWPRESCLRPDDPPLIEDDDVPF